MRIHSTETFLENFIQKIWYSGKYFVYLSVNYKLIEKNYELNSKDDALIVVVQSLKDLQGMVNANQPRQQLVNRIQFVIDFANDVKNSSI
jgi:hypothetical protein